MIPNQEQLRAIEDCNKAYDNIFFYGVKSTLIFCKPSCKSRMPKLENIIVEKIAVDLVNQGYRPCKRCKPTQENLPDVEWIEQVEYFINTHYAENLTLEHIAEETHSSPFHLHRKFKEVTGTTINRYLKDIRMQEAKEILEKSDDAISIVGKQVGIANPSQFIREFKKYVRLTPAKYRRMKDENN